MQRVIRVSLSTQAYARHGSLDRLGNSREAAHGAFLRDEGIRLLPCVKPGRAADFPGKGSGVWSQCRASNTVGIAIVVFAGTRMSAARATILQIFRPCAS